MTKPDPGEADFIFEERVWPGQRVSRVSPDLDIALLSTTMSRMVRRYPPAVAVLGLIVISLTLAMTGCSSSMPVTPVPSPDLLATGEQTAMARQTSLKFTVRWWETPPLSSNLHGEGTWRYQAPDRMDVQRVEYNGRFRSASRDIVIGNQAWHGDDWRSPGTLVYQTPLATPAMRGTPGIGHEGLVSLLHSSSVRIGTVSCAMGHCYQITDAQTWVSGGRFAAIRNGPPVGESVLIDKATMLLVSIDITMTEATGQGLSSVIVNYFDYGIPNLITPPTSA